MTRFTDANDTETVRPNYYMGELKRLIKIERPGFRL